MLKFIILSSTVRILYDVWFEVERERLRNLVSSSFWIFFHLIISSPNLSAHFCMRYYLSHQDWTVSSNNSICCFQNIDTVTSSYIQFIFIISDFGPLAVRHYALINTLSRFCEDLFDTRKKSLPITSAITMAILLLFILVGIAILLLMLLVMIIILYLHS